MKKKNINIFIFIIITLISLILLSFGIGKNIHNLSLVGVLLIYILCLYECFKNIKNNIFLLIFYLMIFVFIISRPMISFLRGDVWYYFSNDSIIWSMVAIYLSLISLLVGKYIYELRNKSNNGEEKSTNKILLFISENKKVITKILFIIFLLVAIVNCYNEIDKLMFMRGKAYEEYYISYTSNIPNILKYINSLFIPVLIILLSLKPRKLYCYTSLSLFLLLQIPMLIIGERGSIIKAVIFVLLYLFMYIGYERIKRFFNVKRVVISIVSVFIVVVFLGSYNYLRSSEKISNYNPFSLFVDFFYRQGTSFDTINKGYDNQNKLPSREKKNYTFGPIIDCINNNIIIHNVFDTKSVSEENSVDAALNGNNLSHALSYTVNRDEYLKGHGIGSSYLIETYLDYSYFGVIIYSLLIGYLLTSMPNILGKTSFLTILCLHMIKEIYVAPRAEAVSFMKFMFRSSFWISIIGFAVIVLFIYKLFKKKGNNKSSIAIIDSDITIMGGVEKVTEQLANKLSNRYDVIIISLKKTNDNIPYSFNDNIKVLFSSEKSDSRLREIIRNNRRNLHKLLKKNNVSIAICMGHYATFTTVLNKRFAETKIINCDHGALINQYDDKETVFMRKINYLFSTHTVSLTNKNKDDYIKLFHAKEDKISVIYNSISNELVTSGKKVKYNLKTNKIVTIGRISYEKGFDMLVKIAARLKEITDVEWQWDIYGDGPEREDVEKEIKKNKLDKYVILKGQNNNVLKLLNDYALYVLPSYREGLPIVLLEAKAYKLPIVSFDVDTGPNEIIEDNKNGYLVEKYDINMMAEKIKKLLENTIIRKDFSNNSNLGLEKFSEKKIIREWIELIERITKE